MRTFFGVVLLWFAIPSAYAGPTSLSVAVVVNEDSVASKMVANDYIRLRRIPPWNVVHLKLGDLDPETIDVETFRDRMLSPVLAALRERGIEKQIDTVAWSVDLPHAVRVESDMKGAKLPGIITPVAAVNGLTFLHERVLGKTPAYLSLSANGYARRQEATPPKTAIKAESVKQFQEAAQLLQKKEHAKAAELFRELAKEHDDHPILHYNLACALAQLGKADEALDALAKAVARGWNDRNHALRDPDFASLKKSDRFRDILAKIRVAVPAGVPFDATEKWNEAGKKGEGNRYLLSTMLGVTTGRGNSLDETLAHLRRSAGADGSRPQGTIFYMINGDVRSRTRQWGFSAAVDALKDLGVQAEAIEGVLPKDRKDVAGLMAGSADFDWPGSKSTILPGAICEHLTSFGGVMHWGAGQTPISEFLRHGASGSSGTVTEPYAIQNKFPTPFLHVYYAQGYSLAEAFYLSVQGPYQLLIIGDPPSVDRIRCQCPSVSPRRTQFPFRSRIRCQCPSVSRRRNQSPFRSRIRCRCPLRIRCPFRCPSVDRIRCQCPSVGRIRCQCPSVSRRQNQFPFRSRIRCQCPFRIRCPSRCPLRRRIRCQCPFRTRCPCRCPSRIRCP